MRIANHSAIQYILQYYSRFMTESEAAAMRQYRVAGRLERVMNGGGNPGEEVQGILKEGFAHFQVVTAERILRDHANGIYFNECPRCGKLARTPQSRQCRHCGHCWRPAGGAIFQLHSAFQVTGGQFFILGEAITGRIETGMQVDLTVLGLSRRPTITDIEYALYREGEESWEDIGLAVADLPFEEKEFLQAGCPFLPLILVG